MKPRQIWKPQHVRDYGACVVNITILFFMKSIQCMFHSVQLPRAKA